MYTVYVLELNSKKKFYIGVTADIDRRLNEHKAGKVRSTKGRFVRVLQTENFSDKRCAWKRENFLKSGKGRELLNNKYGLVAKW